VSEVNKNGDVLHTFADVELPLHFSLDSEGHVMVADYYNNRILLLNSGLYLERVLVDTNSQDKLQCPWRLHYSEITSQQLYVLHNSNSDSALPDVISAFSVR